MYPYYFSPRENENKGGGGWKRQMKEHRQKKHEY